MPRSLSPLVSLNLGTTFLALAQICKSIPVAEPWTAKRAARWDRMTMAAWLDRNVKSRGARELMETAVGGTHTSDTAEVSLLFALAQMASGGGPSLVIGIEGGSQDSRPRGGMGAVYRPMAEHIGDSLHLSASGSRIEQDDDGVTVHAEGIAVRAAIVAVQLAIASQIRYEPMLPGVLIEFGRALRAPCGRIHWAGTESSAVMCGWVGGAIRSGERAAAEVVQKERLGSLNLSA